MSGSDGFRLALLCLVLAFGILVFINVYQLALDHKLHRIDRRRAKTGVAHIFHKILIGTQTVYVLSLCITLYQWWGYPMWVADKMLTTAGGVTFTLMYVYIYKLVLTSYLTVNVQLDAKKLRNRLAGICVFFWAEYIIVEVFSFIYSARLFFITYYCNFFASMILLILNYAYSRSVLKHLHIPSPVRSVSETRKKELERFTRSRTSLMTVGVLCCVYFLAAGYWVYSEPSPIGIFRLQDFNATTKLISWITIFVVQALITKVYAFDTKEMGQSPDASNFSATPNQQRKTASNKALPRTPTVPLSEFHSTPNYTLTVLDSSTQPSTANSLTTTPSTGSWVHRQVSVNNAATTPSSSAIADKNFTVENLA